MQHAARRFPTAGAWSATTALLMLAFGPICQAADERIAGSNLGLLDSVHVALARNPNVLNSGFQVEIAQGQLQQAQGPFDTVFATSLSNQRKHTVNTAADQLLAGEGAADSVASDETNSSVKLTQLLRNGVTIEPSLSISRATDNSVTSQQTAVANRATVAVNVTVPLLKNNGADVVAVGERTAQLELEAVRLDRTQVLSQATLGVVSAYWAYLAAEKSRLVAVDAETSSVRRTEDTNKLVQAEVLPAAERDLVAADGAAKRSARIAAEQALEEARAALARSMGLSPQEAHALPLPGEDFPSVLAPAPYPVRQLERMRELALRQRADLQAAQIRYGQAEINLDATRKGLKPQLDLILGVGVSGLNEGNANTNYFGAANSNLRGPNATLGLNYQFPVQNRGAAGLLTQKQGAVDQLGTNRRDLQASILISIEGLATSVHRLGLQLADSKLSVELYAKSVENEEIRRKMGRSTLIEVLNVSDRLLQARQSLTAVQLNYANAIAQLRFACGAFFKTGGAASSTLVLDRESLLTPP
ncbi:MAG: TolC family protein [Pseudomonadota bacterium]